MEQKKIIFLTGTRADFGKLKPLINIVENSDEFEAYVFVTGMHLLSKYGWTYNEVLNEKYKNIFLHTNQLYNTSMDIALSNTIEGFSSYIKDVQPDLVVIHGDRIEALAGAIVGSLNNIRVAHIEGGEISGTIDGLMRHAISKLSHFHYVANDEAKEILLKMGEKKENIKIIGSPDIDVMLDPNLPTIEEAKKHYDINTDEFAIAMYHPVTTEVNKLPEKVKNFVDALVDSDKKYLVIYPNNDSGSEIIIQEYERLKKDENFKVLPSIRFEYFLSFLKNSSFIIGNSSAGIRESEIYGIRTINVGTRQEGRYKNSSIINVDENYNKLLDAINKVEEIKPVKKNHFGDGNSARLFYQSLKIDGVFSTPLQKKFYAGQ